MEIGTIQRYGSEVADRELCSALSGRPLVNFDRFTSAGRTCTLGSTAVRGARPALSVGCYSSWPAVSGSRVLAAEDSTIRRDGTSKHRWLADLEGRVIVACQELPGPPVFSAWYSHPTLIRIARTVGAYLLTVPAPVRAALEDKTRLNKLLRSAGTPKHLRIPALASTAAPAYADVVSRLGRRLVVQPAAASGGRGTVFVSDEATYERAVAGDGPWRISRFVEGFSSNTTVLTVPCRRGCSVYVDQPSHKPVGITELGIAAAKGAGNDWSPTWPREQTEELVDAITRLGHYLYDVYCLIGLWGVDTIWADGEVVINEINIRNQGTTELSGVNQVLRGQPPLLVAHLTVLAGGSVSWLPNPQDFNTATVERTVAGGRGPYYIKVRNIHSYPVSAGTSWRGSGVYGLDRSEALVWLRSGAHPTDADLDRGEILLANVPAAGVVCAPGAELGTIEGVTTRPLFLGPAELSPLGRKLHRAVMARFPPCSGGRTNP
jgi:hypothetical protein